MIRYSFGAILASLSLVFAPTWAEAVIVNIEISTEGEPVPGTIITFETEEGEEIPPIEVTELTEEPGSPPELETPLESQPAVPTASSAETEDATPAEETNVTDVTSGSGTKLELPDTFVGKGVVVVVRKDDTLIKREPITLEEGSSDIDIEAYDPADAELGIDFSQPKQCQRGERCDYEIAVTNEGNGIYTGPLFLGGQLHGTLAEPDGEEEWWCRNAGGGRQFCFIQASLEPGASKTWTLSAQLPKRISQSANNCLEIRKLDEGPSGRTDPLVQAVQAGLAAKGISTGRPDGVAGPATRAAMAKYIDQAGLEPSADQAAVFESLFGLSLGRHARLEVSTGKDCENLNLTPQPQTVTKEPKGKSTASKKSGTTSKSSSSNTTSSEARKKERRKRALSTGIGIGIGIGIGAATKGSNKSGRHNRN